VPVLPSSTAIVANVGSISLLAIKKRTMHIIA
jgi:hypothetical protein